MTTRTDRSWRPDGVADHGCYHLPTVVTDVTANMEIRRDDEVFGPIVVVFEVDGLDEPIDDWQYGLSAAVDTNRLDAAERFADEADCGQIAASSGAGS